MFSNEGKITAVISDISHISSVSKKNFGEYDILGQKLVDYVKNAVTCAGMPICQIGGSSGKVLVISPDIPLISAEEIKKYIDFHNDNGGVYSSCKYGTASIIDAGYVSFGELGDVIIAEGPEKVIYDCPEAFKPVLSAKDLISAQNQIANKKNEELLESGVIIINPGNTFIAPDVSIGADTVVYPNTFILGNSKIGSGCVIGQNCNIVDMEIGDGVAIECSVLKSSKVGSFSKVGPFAYVRPGCEIGEHAKIGDFVEVKNSKFGNNSKASHLTYIGDSDVGDNINLGCGVVTVNYDGHKKYRTVIGDNSFIGCNSNLVAPVKIGEGSYVACGSTITDDVPEDNLAIARARQVNKSGWKLKK